MCFSESFNSDLEAMTQASGILSADKREKAGKKLLPASEPKRPCLLQLHEEKDEVDQQGINTKRFHEGQTKNEGLGDFTAGVGIAGGTFAGGLDGHALSETAAGGGDGDTDGHTQGADAHTDGGVVSSEATEAMATIITVLRAVTTSLRMSNS